MSIQKENDNNQEKKQEKKKKQKSKSKYENGMNDEIDALADYINGVKTRVEIEDKKMKGRLEHVKGMIHGLENKLKKLLEKKEYESKANDLEHLTGRINELSRRYEERRVEWEEKVNLLEGDEMNEIKAFKLIEIVGEDEFRIMCQSRKDALSKKYNEALLDVTKKLGIILL